MRKLLSVLLLLLVSSILSGCIFSTTPTTNKVIVVPDGAQVFTVNVLSPGGTYVWRLDGEDVATSESSFTYTPADDGKTDQTLVFEESSFLGTYSYEWNVIDAEVAVDVGPAGGSVMVSDPDSPIVGTTVDIPEEILTDDATITISAVETPSSLDSQPIGNCIDFGPEGIVFDDPVEILLSYNDIDNDGIVDGTAVPEEEIRVKYYNEVAEEWENVDIEEIYISQNKIKILVNHFSKYIITGSFSITELFTFTIPFAGFGDVEPIEPLMTDGNSYFAVAASGNNEVNVHTDSLIYKWDGTTLTIIQYLPTVNAFDMESFLIDSDIYLAVANHADYQDTPYQESKIYKWNGSAFIEIQSITTSNAMSWASFTIGTDSYLALACSDNSSTTYGSRIFKWNKIDEEFDIIQDNLIADTTSDATDWEHFTIADKTYLALAISAAGDEPQSNIVNSKIYEWNGSEFIVIQDIQTEHGLAWNSFNIGDDTYLAATNHLENSADKIYRWNNSINQFEEVFSTPAIGRTGVWSSFTVDGDTYLSQAYYEEGENNTILNMGSKIYQWAGNEFVDVTFFNNLAFLRPYYLNGITYLFGIIVIDEQVEGSQISLCTAIKE